jgi:hypothetical protein
MYLCLSIPLEHSTAVFITTQPSCISTVALQPVSPHPFIPAIPLCRVAIATSDKFILQDCLVSSPPYLGLSPVDLTNRTLPLHAQRTRLRAIPIIPQLYFKTTFYLNTPSRYQEPSTDLYRLSSHRNQSSCVPDSLGKAKRQTHTPPP